jgi:hypothetical protein
MNAIMMTWDYLFLSKWSKRSVINVAMSILGLIRPWMMRATGYAGVRKVKAFIIIFLSVLSSPTQTKKKQF